MTGTTQTHFGHLVGVSRATVSRWERIDGCFPKRWQLTKLKRLQREMLQATAVIRTDMRPKDQLYD